eukprot:6198715-Pleurochrysis_carterae.AAC.1
MQCFRSIKLIDGYMHSQEFVEDMRAAGAGCLRICTEVWSGEIFRTEPSLAHITIASGKKNFGRCTICGNLEAAIKIARNAGDTQRVLDKKNERKQHYLLERADKVHCYACRVKARAPAADLVSAIIDKMDGNKNKCPGRAAFH